MDLRSLDVGARLPARERGQRATCSKLLSVLASQDLQAVGTACCVPFNQIGAAW